MGFFTIVTNSCDIDYKQLTIYNILWYIYIGVIFYATFTGICSGTELYNEWYKERHTVTIDSRLYDPIINICRDIGVYAFYVSHGGLCSGIIAAIAPVCIPILLYNVTQVV